MTVDEAVTLHMQRMMLDEGYIVRKEAKEIAKEAADASKDEFSHSLSEMSKEIDRIRERTDRLFEASLKTPDLPSWWTKMWRKILWWRD